MNRAAGFMKIFLRMLFLSGVVLFLETVNYQNISIGYGQDTSLPKTSMAGADPAMSTFEAADIAYRKAIEWDRDATLWYMNPASGVDFRWYENDRSWHWGILFVRHKDEKRYNIRIKNGKIIDAVEEKYTKKEIPIPADCPRDRPRISMKQAADAVIATKTVKGDSLVGLYTLVAAKKALRGKPVWSFIASCPQLLLDVDGMTGKLLEIRDYNGTVLTLQQAMDLVSIPCKNASELREKNAIYLFFQSINNRKVDQAIGMMTGELAGNSQMRQMWRTNFESLNSLRVIHIFSPEPSKEKDKPVSYKVTLYAEPKPDAGYVGWEPGENLRWLRVSQSGDTCKIAEIATSP